MVIMFVAKLYWTSFSPLLSILCLSHFSDLPYLNSPFFGRLRLHFTGRSGKPGQHTVSCAFWVGNHCPWQRYCRGFL